MTLGFSTKWKDGAPTYFIEKVWRSFHKLSPYTEAILEDRVMYLERYDNKFGQYWDLADAIPPKIHTIRADNHNRWKAGNKIHFVVGNRTKKRFQFAPVLNVTSIQTVEIKYYRLNESQIKRVDIYIDNRFIGRYYPNTGQYHHSLLELAKNDGFETVKDFFKWFDKDFEGKIIHWTKHKY